jgi:hypothetical protein
MYNESATYLVTMQPRIPGLSLAAPTMSHSPGTSVYIHYFADASIMLDIGTAICAEAKISFILHPAARLPPSIDFQPALPIVLPWWSCHLL